LVVLVFGLGLVCGLALNALADALPPDALGVKHPLRWLHCAYCGGGYAPRAWLALGQWLMRRGRCERCGAVRRRRHAVAELILGLCLAGEWVWAAGQWAAFVPAAVLTFIFALIVIIDVEHRLVLWRVVLSSAVVIAVMQSLTRGPVKTLLGGAAGYGMVLGMFLLGQLFSAGLARLRGQPLDEVAFGGGDVNLAALVGLAVGWPAILLALMVTVFSGGVFALAYLVVQVVRRRYNPYTAFPYGPFFVLGAAVLYFAGPNVAAWYNASR
jgi:leader peptidase (prepilin peptidase) / N-methyltransferase